MEIRSYRDTPKRGETDAKWCAYIVGSDGHIKGVGTSGHETEAEARAAMGEVVKAVREGEKP